LNIIGIRKQGGSGQRPSVMEEDCTGSQRSQYTAALGKEKKKYYAFPGVYWICAGVSEERIATIFMFTCTTII
jgi:hypothetical protein